MKVYAAPVPFAEPDYANYDTNVELARETAHQEQVAQWLRDNGYVGERTGQIARFGVADGYAQYMVGDTGPRMGGMVLIHLPYGDAYSFPYVTRLSKKDIVENVERQQRLAALFSGQGAA